MHSDSVTRRRGDAGRRTPTERAMRDLDDITEAMIDAAIQIHRDLGPGLLESVYEAVLARGPAPRRQRSPSRRISAPPREPIRVNSTRHGLNAPFRLGRSIACRWLN